MEEEHLEIEVKGRYSKTEEAILNYLYENPGVPTCTVHILSTLIPEDAQTNPDTGITQTQRKEFDEIQYGIETLIEAGLAAGKRVINQDQLQYVQLRLTAEGEKEAIRQRRRLKKIILPRVVKGERARPPLLPAFEKADLEE